MSVMVLKDDVVAELAFAQTRDNMMENNEDFPRVAHMAYLLLSDIIRKTTNMLIQTATPHGDVGSSFDARYSRRYA
jgi:hypothetical protein